MMCQKLCVSFVALEEVPTYINPTNDCSFHGCTIDTVGIPKLAPSPTAGLLYKSFEGTLKLFAEIESAGLAVELNPLAPLVHDFYLRIPGFGLLRVELKDYLSLEGVLTLLDSPRRNPFDKRRLWHVLLILVEEQVVCVTRDEVGRDFRLEIPWLQQGACNDFAATMPRIKEHATQAKCHVLSALRNMQPEDIYQGITEGQLNIEIYSPDPLSGHKQHQRTLTWLALAINERCAKDGYGICFALDASHPVADHIFVKYRWTPEEQQAFEGFRTMPTLLWSRTI